MELREFIKVAIISAVKAIEEAGHELNRDIQIARPQDNRSIEIDVAVTVENSRKDTAGITIFNALDFSGKDECKNSSVSRIRLGISIPSLTNDALQANRDRTEKIKKQHSGNY